MALSLHQSWHFCYYVCFNKSTPVRPFNSIATMTKPRQIRPIFPFRMVVIGHTFGWYGCNHSASMAILSLFYVETVWFQKLNWKVIFILKCWLLSRDRAIYDASLSCATLSSCGADLETVLCIGKSFFDSRAPTVLLAMTPTRSHNFNLAAAHPSGYNKFQRQFPMHAVHAVHCEAKCMVAWKWTRSIPWEMALFKLHSQTVRVRLADCRALREKIFASRVSRHDRSVFLLDWWLPLWAQLQRRLIPEIISVRERTGEISWTRFPHITIWLVLRSCRKL